MVKINGIDEEKKQTMKMATWAESRYKSKGQRNLKGIWERELQSGLKGSWQSLRTYY